MIITILAFQNFRFYDSNRNIQGQEMDFDQMKIVDYSGGISSYKGKKVLKDIYQDRNPFHEIKTQVYDNRKVDLPSSHLNPEIVYDSKIRQHVMSFETELRPQIKKTRSEIRPRGNDIFFSDSDSDIEHFAKFEIFIPKDGENQLYSFPKNNKMWNIIWQVGQVGAETAAGYSRNTSPPISLQFFDRRLYLVTKSSRYSADMNTQAKNIWSVNKNFEFLDPRDLDRNKIENRREIRKRTADFRIFKNILERSPDKNNLNEGDVKLELNRLKSRFENLAPARPMLYVGYVKENAWNKIFIKFKMGKNGYVDVWVNDSNPVRSGKRSIGYQTAEDPFNTDNPSDIVTMKDGTFSVKKRASTRFGLYQGYKDRVWYRQRSAYVSKILFKNYSVGTDWNKVRFSSQ